MVYMVILPPYFMVFPTPFPFWDVGISGDSITICYGVGNTISFFGG